MLHNPELARHLILCETCSEMPPFFLLSAQTFGIISQTDLITVEIMGVHTMYDLPAIVFLAVSTSKAT